MFSAKRVTTEFGPKSSLAQLMKIHNSASNEEQISKNNNIRVFHRQVQFDLFNNINLNRALPATRTPMSTTSQNVKKDHAAMSLGFKCMAELLNRLMLVITVICLLVAYGCLVFSTFPFHDRSRRVRQVIEMGDFCPES